MGDTVAAVGDNAGEFAADTARDLRELFIGKLSELFAQGFNGSKAARYTGTYTASMLSAKKKASSDDCRSIPSRHVQQAD